MTKSDFKKTTKGYYDFDVEDIDIEAILLEQGLVEDLFYLRDLQQRKLVLDGEVSQLGVGEIEKHILQYNKEDKDIPLEDRKPIILYIASPGGSVDAGFGLIDIIIASETPVYTVNVASAYSMAFLILLAGHKRFGMKNSTYLMHDGNNFIYNSSTKAQDQMEFYRRSEARVRNYVLSRSKLSEEEYDKQLRVEWYLFSNEAKEKGFIDSIVGEDCTIEEIV